MIGKNLQKPRLAAAAAFFSYLLIALVFTFPLALHMSDSIFGPPEDNFQYVWNFWWIKKALTEPGQTLYFTDYLFYPNGISFYFQSFSFANSLLSVPLQWFFTPWQAYNILVLLIFAGRGLGMFLLARYFVRNSAAAFLAGFIFSFSPFFFHKSLHHLNVSSAHFIPFLILSLFWLRERPTFRNGLCVGLFLWLNALNCWVYLVFAAFAAAAVLLGFALGDYRRILRKEFIRSLVTGMAAFAAAISPLLFPLLRELAKGRNYMVVQGKSPHFLDPVFLLLPSDIHPINRWIENFFLKIYNHRLGDNWELNYFVGYTAVFLALWGIVRLVKLRQFFWIGFGALFLVISLGASLHVAGFDTEIPLPYSAMTQMPLVKLSRVPGRFFGLSLCAISIFSAYGFCAAAERIRRLRPGIRVRWLVMGAVMILTFEYLPFPIELTPVAPTRAESRMAADTACTAVLDIPLWGYMSHHKAASHLTFRGKQYRQTHYVSFPAVHTFRQILHHKKLLGGYGSRIPPEAYHYFAGSPLKAFEDLDTIALSNTDAQRRIREELQNLKVGYVVLHGDFIRAQRGPDTGPQLHFLRKYLVENFQQVESGIPDVDLFQVASKRIK